MPDYIGELLGNYRITRLLGSGGFAQVYLGEHIYLKTTAAIKVALTNLSQDDQQAFLNEARMIARLRHPHIVRVLEFGVTPGHVPFLAMAYAPHGTLRQRHPLHTRVPLEKVIMYVRQIAPALQFAHDQRLIHRDIKPENMLLNSRDEILLSDFGIAVNARNTFSQEREKVSGTAFYMAPEQLQGKPRPASDQYSLGTVVYEWLCGTPPFMDPSLLTVAFHHLQVTPRPLHEIISLPPAIEAAVMRTLAKDPGERFPDMPSFMQAMEAAYAERDALSCLATAPLSFTAPTSQNPPADNIYTPKNIDSAARITTDPGNLHVNSLISPGVRAQRTSTSRRAVVTGLLGIAGLSAVGGAFTWYTRTFQQSIPPHLRPTPTKPTFTLPTRAPGTTLFTYKKHTGPVTSVSWSPDGSQVASASNDKTVHIWNLATPDAQQPFIYSKHTDKVISVAWSPAGTAVASASLDQTVRVWTAPIGTSTTPGQTLTVYQGGTQITPAAICWSPDSQQIAMTSQAEPSQVQIWDATSGKHAIYYFDPSQAPPPFGPGPSGAVAWSPDGASLATSIVSVALWDIASGNRILTYEPETYDLQYLAKGLAWSPDNKHVALASSNSTVLIWESDSGKTLLTYKNHSASVYAVSWSPDGKYVASASQDKTVQIWEASTGTLHLTYRTHTAPVNTVFWSRDSRHLVSGDDNHTVLIWQGI